MKSVGIIIYFLKQELIGNNGLNAKRAYEEILKVIERDINQRGGINGVKLKIHLLILIELECRYLRS